MKDVTIGIVDKDLDGETVIVTPEYNAYFEMLMGDFYGKKVKITIEEVEDEPVHS